jgi:hypothetical protein
MKTYSELSRLTTFDDRFQYLRLRGEVGEVTFGFERYLNQVLYHSRDWKYTKDDIILRDNACDLGIPGLEIAHGLLVHHINPITIEDLETGADCIFNPNNLITTVITTHNAIHFGVTNLSPRLPLQRSVGDTRLW